MKKLKKNDIALYLNAIPDEFCEKLIREFHKGFALKEVISGVVSAEGVGEYRSDDLLVAKDIHLYDHARWDGMNHDLHKKYLIPVLKNYLSDYKYILKTESEIDPRSCIISLYEKNKGHFCPHQDALGGLEKQRSLTVICYLNTVYNGGCTHFFNQDYRVSPIRGSVVVFPSNFVYSHIGEKPVSGDKYITVSFVSVDVGDDSKLEHYKHV